MYKLTISNIDTDTTEIHTFIAEKAGGKVLKNAKEKATSSSKKQEHFAAFNKQFDDIILQVKDKHNAISKHKIK
ncbi:MAG: hypothetical protein RJA25_1300 [Bacteroidota bacterium]|jgi:hypothetical protein